MGTIDWTNKAQVIAFAEKLPVKGVLVYEVPDKMREFQGLPPMYRILTPYDGRGKDVHKGAKIIHKT